MTNLNDYATKLQTFLIREAQDDGRRVSKARYNNLKMKISSRLQYPNVIITIGISEATYNIEDGTKTEGSLGPDERYVYKWLSRKEIQPALKELYLQMTELVDLEEEQQELKEELEDEMMGDMEGFAGESKIDDRPSRHSKKNNFRNLMMPSQYLEREEEETKRRKEGLIRREDAVITPLETVSAAYEEFNEETDLEIYNEQKLESLENLSKQHDLMNFMKGMFARPNKDDDE